MELPYQCDERIESMTRVAPSYGSNFDRVLLPMAFDAQRMLEEVAALTLPGFIEYNVLPLRSPAYLVDASIPRPPPVADYADGSWTDWLDTPALESSRYLTEVVDTFRAHSRVTLVRLLRLAPGAIVKDHTDPTLGLHIEKAVVRLTIPIASNDSEVFFLNDVPVPMMPGECWYLRLTDPHRIVNEGSTERINMTIDLEPNEWLKSLFEGHQAS